MTCDRCESDPCNCVVARRPMEDLRSVKSRKTGVRYFLCEWDGKCNIPVRTGIDGDKLCRFHKSCERAPDQAYNYEAFQSWHAWMLNLKYDHSGWWGKPSEDLWPVIQGERGVIA